MRRFDKLNERGKLGEQRFDKLNERSKLGEQRFDKLNERSKLGEQRFDKLNERSKLGEQRFDRLNERGKLNERSKLNERGKLGEPRAPHIEVRDLRVDLGGRTVLHDVDLTVSGGEVVYLLGRNGAGKSTLLRSICGMVTPRSGSVFIGGTPVRSLGSPARRLGMHLGIETVHPGHTARRHLRWVAAAAGLPRSRVDDVLDITGVAAYGDRRIGGYSLGMRQRLGIATALLPDAHALVFDEPLNGLDVEGIVWFRLLLTELASRGRGVVVATHLLAEVQRSAGDSASPERPVARVVLVDRGTTSPAVGVSGFVGEHADLEAAYLAALGPAETGALA
ncbi:ABC transporter ATP-binding protein [Gordonia iterans]